MCPREARPGPSCAPSPVPIITSPRQQRRPRARCPPARPRRLTTLSPPFRFPSDHQRRGGHGARGHRGGPSRDGHRRVSHRVPRHRPSRARRASPRGSRAPHPSLAWHGASPPLAARPRSPATPRASSSSPARPTRRPLPVARSRSSARSQRRRGAIPSTPLPRDSSTRTRPRKTPCSAPSPTPFSVEASEPPFRAT